MQTQTNPWEKVPKVPGFYRRKLRGGMSYRFRLPGSTSWMTNSTNLDLEEAKRWRAQLLGQLPVERIVPSHVRFLPYATERITTRPGIRDSTRRTYLTQLNHSLGYLHHLEVAEITAEHIAMQIALLKAEGKSPSTIHQAVAITSSIFKYAKRQRLVSENPVGELLPEERVPLVTLKEKNHFTSEEFDAFYGQCQEPFKSIVATAVCLGLRLSEVLGLVWGDFDFDTNRVAITQQKGRGSSTVREDLKSRSATLDVPAVLRRILIERKLMTPVTGADDYVFVTKNGTPFSQRNVARMFRNTMIATGINDEDTPPAERITFHALRKTFTSAVVERSDVGDIARVSGDLRHGKKEMTLELYTKRFDEAQNAGKTGAAVDDAFGRILSR